MCKKQTATEQQASSYKGLLVHVLFKKPSKASACQQLWRFKAETGNTTEASVSEGSCLRFSQKRNGRQVRLATSDSDLPCSN